MQYCVQISAVKYLVDTMYRAQFWYRVYLCNAASTGLIVMIVEYSNAKQYVYNFAISGLCKKKQCKQWKMILCGGFLVVNSVARNNGWIRGRLNVIESTAIHAMIVMMMILIIIIMITTLKCWPNLEMFVTNMFEYRKCFVFPLPRRWWHRMTIGTSVGTNVWHMS